MHGLLNAIYGTLFTWGLTALGAACVLIVPGKRRDVLDISLGFSGGVMLAASYWSLLSPALDLAEKQGWGKGSCIPVSIGLVLGAGFVLLADLLLPDTVTLMSNKTADNKKIDGEPEDSITIESRDSNMTRDSEVRHRKPNLAANSETSADNSKIDEKLRKVQLRRLVLLIVAITVHNFPEGLAVGVGYASVGRPGVDLQQAHNLAIGIGLQNFPEGLAVSVPLKAAGFSTFDSFFWGQASGMVEPIAGIIGVICVTLVEQILSIALSFAAGAMIWVVCNDIVPEASAYNHTRLCSIGVIVGFVVMMCLDTALA